MNDITTASDEQRDGIEQVNHAITQMDAVTQQNAALVEQAAAAAASMQEQSARLSEVVGVFKLNRLTAPPPPPQRAAAPARTSTRAPVRQLGRATTMGAAPAPAPRKPVAAIKDEWEEF